MIEEIEKYKMLQRSQDYSDALLRLNSFAEFKERGQKFYRNLASEVKECAYRRGRDACLNESRLLRIAYDNQTAIPNAMKTNTLARRMSLHLLRGGHTLSINKEVMVAHSSTLIHIADGHGILRVRNEREFAPLDYALTRNTSWEFSPQQVEGNTLIIRPSDNYLIIAIEQFVPEPRNPIPETIPDHPFERELQQGQSWVKEEGGVCMFLAVRFAVGQDNQHYPVQISVVNQIGQIMMHTHVCPRVRIKNWQTPHHGVTEENSKNQPDHYWVYQRLQEVLRNRIVVSIGTYEKLKRLKIDLNTVNGIRDLRTSKAFEKDFTGRESSRINAISATIIKYPEPKKEEDLPSWTLKHLMFSELGQTVKEPHEDPLDEAQLIRTLFKKVMNRWIDHATPQKTTHLLPQKQTSYEDTFKLPSGPVRYHFKKPPKIRISRTIVNDTITPRNIHNEGTTTSVTMNIPTSEDSYTRTVLLSDESTKTIQHRQIRETEIPKTNEKVPKETDIKPKVIEKPIMKSVVKPMYHVNEGASTSQQTLETIMETSDCYVFSAEDNTRAEKDFPSGGESPIITEQRRQELIQYFKGVIPNRKEGRLYRKINPGLDLDDSDISISDEEIPDIPHKWKNIEVEERLRHSKKHKTPKYVSLPGSNKKSTKEPLPKKPKG
jgi:hypothetical protein